MPDTIEIDYFCYPLPCKSCKEARSCQKANDKVADVVREWVPGNEPKVLIECGCVVVAWPVIELLGQRKELAYCDKHGDWLKILRKATLMDILKWLGYSSSSQSALF